MAYVKLNFNSFGEGFPANSGVYKIIALNENTPIFINRILGTDPEGVLYIGMSENIQWRMGYFIKTILENYKTECHSGGRMYNYSLTLKNKYPKECLAVSYELCDNIREKELELLNNYINKYGELPPLNSSY